MPPPPRAAPLPPRWTPVTFLQHSPAWKFGRARSSLCFGIRKYAVALTLVTVAISVTGQRSGPRSLTTQANCSSMIDLTRNMLILLVWLAHFVCLFDIGQVLWPLVTVAISVTGQRLGPRSFTTQANCSSIMGFLFRTTSLASCFSFTCSFF